MTNLLLNLHTLNVGFISYWKVIFLFYLKSNLKNYCLILFFVGSILMYRVKNPKTFSVRIDAISNNFFFAYIRAHFKIHINYFKHIN